jgi:hypothetical protein
VSKAVLAPYQYTRKSMFFVSTTEVASARSVTSPYRTLRRRRGEVEFSMLFVSAHRPGWTRLPGAKLVVLRWLCPNEKEERGDGPRK